MQSYSSDEEIDESNGRYYWIIGLIIRKKIICSQLTRCTAHSWRKYWKSCQNHPEHQTYSIGWFATSYKFKRSPKSNQEAEDKKGPWHGWCTEYIDQTLTSKRHWNQRLLYGFLSTFFLGANLQRLHRKNRHVLQFKSLCRWCGFCVCSIQRRWMALGYYLINSKFC